MSFAALGVAPGDDRLGEIAACLARLRGWTDSGVLRRLGVAYDGDRLRIPIVDAAGTLVGVQRYQPDPERRNGAGKMVALSGSKRDLWPRPEDVAGEELFVAEGEPDAVALSTAGLPAVSVPGVGKWDEQWPARLAAGRKRIVVVPDCDDPGRKLAKKLASEVFALGVEVRVLDLVGLSAGQKGYDVGDALRECVEAGDSPDRLGLFLRELAEAVAPFAPPFEGTKNLRLLDVSQMVSEDPPQVPWRVEGIAVDGELTFFTGREGKGKSLISQALTVGVAAGESVMGLHCEQGRVCIIDAENGSQEIHRRIRNLGLPAEAANSVSILEADGLDLRHGLAQVEEALRTLRPNLLILDSFRTLWAGEENDSAEVTNVLTRLKTLVRDAGCACVILHHLSKGGSDYRGSSAIGATAVIGLVLLEQDGDPDESRRKLKWWKCRPAARPEPRWLRLSAERDMVLVEEAEAPVEEDRKPAAPKRQEICESLLTAASPTRGSTRAELAGRVGKSPKDGTFRRALDSVLASGDLFERGDGLFYTVDEPTTVPSATPPGGSGTLAPGTLTADEFAHRCLTEFDAVELDECEAAMVSAQAEQAGLFWDFRSAG